MSRKRREWPEGVRASLPLILPTAAVGVSFGLLAAPALGALPAVLMSGLVWAGTAQFAALSVVTGGGGLGLAVGAAMLANARFLPMGFALAPSMTGGLLTRIGQGALLVDASFVIAHRPDGRFDLRALVWSAPAQYVGWVGGTLAGVLGARAIGDPARWGLDVLFPVFYLSLLLPELRRGAEPEPATAATSPSRPRWNRRAVVAAVLAAALAVALVPIAPPGVPVVAAAAAALIGLWSPRPTAEPGAASE